MRFSAIRLFFILIILPFGLVIPLRAQENNFINVHFIHGSKPRKAFKQEEQKWKGGIWGGHVGIEIDSDRVIDFKPQGRFHWLAHRNKRNSVFTIHTQDGFWAYDKETSNLETRSIFFNKMFSFMNKNRIMYCFLAQ